MLSALLAPVSAGGHTIKWKFTHEKLLNCLKIYSLLSLFKTIAIIFRYAVAVWCRAVQIIVHTLEQSGLSKCQISVLYYHKIHAVNFCFMGVATEIFVDHWRKVSYAFLLICVV